MVYRANILSLTFSRCAIAIPAGMVLLAVTAPLAAQQLTVERFLSIEGQVESVGPGSLVVTDQDGQRYELQIADRSEETIALREAGVLLKFPAKVRVFGVFAADAVTPGSLVRFSGRVNRAGQTSGEVTELTLLEDSAQSTSVEPQAEPQSARDHAEVTLTVTVFRVRGNRLTVNVPENQVTHRDRIAFTLAKEASINMESDDYRRAEPGDRVVALRAALLSSGDQVVQQLTIEKQQRTSEATDADAALMAKYRHLSDEPAAIRVERSRHFLLHTDISPRSAAILLEKLETMIGLVSGYYGRPPRQAIECYVVTDITQWPAGTFDPIADQSIRSRAGVTQSRTLGRQTRAVVYACDDHGTVQHEAVHAYCSQTFGSSGPVWYAEGMAEMGNYWTADEAAVNIPAVAVHYLRNTAPKSMAEIVAAGQITGDSWEAYQWRWALCYLLANNPNYSRHFKGLGIGLMTEAPGVSFEAVYGGVAPQISFEYDQFLTKLDNGYRVDLAAWQWDRKFLPLQAGRRVRVQVEAARGWQATGAIVNRGENYDYVAEGQWNVHSNAATTADGAAEGKGRLIGVVMHDLQLSEPFELGTRGSFVAPESGDLFLRCQDEWNALADNEGQLTVHLRVTPGK